MGDCGCGGGDKSCVTKNTAKIVAEFAAGSAIVGVGIFTARMAKGFSPVENSYESNFNFIYSSLDYIFNPTFVVAAFGVGAVSIAYYNVIHSVKVDYTPLLIGEYSYMKEIPSAQIMIGDSTNNFLAADENGSKIWAKGGLNFMQAGDGIDEFYFSLCSTKIINNRVSVIYNFDPNQDKLNFFCTKHQIKLSDISVKHLTFSDGDYTCIEVNGIEDTSAICLIGNIDIMPKDINITTLGDVKIELGLE